MWCLSNIWVLFVYTVKTNLYSCIFICDAVNIWYLSRTFTVATTEQTNFWFCIRLYQRNLPKTSFGSVCILGCKLYCLALAGLLLWSCLTWLILFWLKKKYRSKSYHETLIIQVHGILQKQLGRHLSNLMVNLFGFLYFNQTLQSSLVVDKNHLPRYSSLYILSCLHKYMSKVSMQAIEFEYLNLLRG